MKEGIKTASFNIGHIFIYNGLMGRVQVILKVLSPLTPSGSTTSTFDLPDSISSQNAPGV
jgi:hypothetical protein